MTSPAIKSALVLMAFIAAIPCYAGEQWFFLPNYRHDIRGIEKPPENGIRFNEFLPSAAESLLRSEALGEGQKEQLFQHEKQWMGADKS